MSYLALYRKYRPRKFSEVHGQSAIVQTLKNQSKSGRIANAYLFSGPRGTGKTSIAKIFTQAISCISPIDGEPCMNCISCKMAMEGANPDIIEIDAASNNGVDNIREIIDTAKYMPQYGRFKAYIIDEVHMLSSSAFNALLKTLEEPVPNTVFVLATTEYQKVPATIVSRCQRYQFKLLSDDEIHKALDLVCNTENIQVEDKDSVFRYIAKTAHGGLRDAYSLLDQLSIYGDRITIQTAYNVFGDIQDDVITDIASSIEKGDVETALLSIEKQEREGKSLSCICTRMYEYYRDKFIHEQSPVFQRHMQILANLSEKMKYDNTKTNMEIGIIKMCKPEMESDYCSLSQRVQQLENMIRNTPNVPQETIAAQLPTYSNKKQENTPIDNLDVITVQYERHNLVNINVISCNI